MIASILQMSQISRCPNVEIEILLLPLDIDTNTNRDPTQLPVEAISNWLAGKLENGEEICDKKEENRFLTIYSRIILNAKEICDHLEQVNIYISR